MDRKFLSFMTEVTDFLLIIFILLIYFMAKIFLLFFSRTFQTLPNPPLPTGIKISRWALLRPYA